MPTEELPDNEESIEAVNTDIDEIEEVEEIFEDFQPSTEIVKESDDFKLSFDEKDSLFQDESENVIKSEDVTSEEKDFFECINQLSMELSTLPQEKGAMQLFHSMTSLSFGFSKSSLLLFSPSQQQFQCCEFENLDDKTLNKLHFSVDFENLYQETSENGYLFIEKNSDKKGILSHFLSEEDLANTDFLLLIPYIFASRMIGLFAGFKLHNDEKVSPALIEALSLVCRLNAALLYSLYQTESLLIEMEKENNLPDVKDSETEELINIDESPEIEIYNNEELPNVENSDNSEISSLENINETEEDVPESTPTEKSQNDRFQSFDEKYHKILFYLQKTIESSPDIPLSVLKIQLTNTDNLEKQIEGFKIDIFISDIQFIVMNIVGANGLVSMFDDFSIYAILPEADSQIASMLLEKITVDIRNMFSEIFGDCTVEFANTAVNYPEDSQDFAELFYMAQNGK